MGQLILRLQSRAFYFADLLAGHALGLHCPSCSGRHKVDRISKLGGIGTIFECQSCQLLYRSTGLMMPAVARWYYSYAYGDAGLATAPSVTDDVEELQRKILAEGKDRSTLVLRLLTELPRERRRVCVLGCSWGYEIALLRRADVDAYGIELSGPRRRFGIEQLGLEIYATPEAAALARESRTGLVMSSHVLEHIPDLDVTLKQVTKQLAPLIQIHITPCVEPSTPHEVVKHNIGREHPIGVTGAFWIQWAKNHALDLELRFVSSETIAMLRSQT